MDPDTRLTLACPFCAHEMEHQTDPEEVEGWIHLECSACGFAAHFNKEAILWGES